MSSSPDSGDEAWVLLSATLVFLMVPALALFYGGAVSDKSVLLTMTLSFGSMAVGSLFWALIGHSLAFGPGNPYFLGSLSYGLFDSADRLRDGTRISEHTFFIFQCAFNSITLAVISGSVAGRMTLLSFLAFCVLWSVLVYCPLAHWIFYSDGWLSQLGVLDFAGGLVVETASGLSAFVLAAWMGRGELREGVANKPHSIPFALLGSGLLWCGWFGFNGGSALTAGYSAGRALANTHLCACAALITWALCEIVAPPAAHSAAPGATRRWLTGRPTALGAATGAVVGLVAITPACGYISLMASVLLGVVAAPICFAAVRVLHRCGVDDRLECLPCHGVAGAVGVVYIGLFASASAGSPTNGLLYGGGAAQLGKQLLGLGITVALCIVGTSAAFLLLAAAARLLRLPLRVADEHSPDLAEHGELAYAWMTDVEDALGADEAALTTTAAATSRAPQTAINSATQLLAAPAAALS